MKNIFRGMKGLNQKEEDTKSAKQRSPQGSKAKGMRQRMVKRCPAVSAVLRPQEDQTGQEGRGHRVIAKTKEITECE